MVMAAVGYVALPPSIADHETLKAGTLRNFRVAFARSLAFPWINYPRATAIMWLPLAVVGLIVLWRRLRTTTIEQVTLTMGAWVVVQCAAMAYSRGANGAAPASRYLDMVALGYLANTTVILSWLTPRTSRRLMAASAFALVAWFAVTGIGIYRVSREMLATHAPLRRQWTREHIRNVRQFVMTDDVRSFLELKGPQDVPYYSAAMLASWLEHPYIRRHTAGCRAGAARRQAAWAPARGGLLDSSGAAYPQPVFDSYASAGATGEARFESEPVTCLSLGLLRFEVSSSASWSGLQLSLKRLQTGQETRVGPPWLAAGGWVGITAPCPDGPFKVVAVDTSPTSWFAFRQPAEIAFGSAVAGSVVQRSRFVGFTAIVLALVAVAGDGPRMASANRDSRNSSRDPGRRPSLMAPDSPPRYRRHRGRLRDLWWHPPSRSTSSPATRSADARGAG